MKRLAIITAILLTASTALAGQKLSYPVTVTASDAWGALGSARNAVDTTQALQIQNTPTFSTLFARDATGKSGTCTTTDPALMTMARSATGDSYVYFAWDASAKCTTVIVWAASWAAPKAP